METSALLRIMALRQVLLFGLEFGTTLVVARLLTPEQIGTFSVAVAAVFVAMALRTGSVSTFLVQARELGRNEVGNALGFALVISVVLGLAVVLVRHPIADFYGAPEMAPLLLVMAGSISIAPLQGVAAGLLRRDLLIGRMATAELAGAAVGNTTTLVLAYLDYGPIALAYGALVRSVLMTILYCVFSPRLLWTRPRFNDWREVGSVSGWAMAFTMTHQLGQRMNELVIGRTIGLADAAMLDRANTLPRLIWYHLLPPVISVLTPVMAREMRSGEHGHAVAERRMRMAGIVFVPILLGMASQSEPLILFLFGDQWVAAVEPAIWLCVSAAIGAQFSVVNSTLLAMGRTRDMFIASLIEQTGRAIVLALFATQSIVAIAIGSVAVGICHAATLAFFAAWRDILPFRRLPRAIGRGLAAGAVVYAVGYVTRLLLTQYTDLGHGPMLGIAVVVLAATLALLLALLEPDVLRFGLKMLRLRRT